MQSSQSPTLMPLPFASGGGKNTIPEASQLPANPGGASYTDGFPPATRTPIVAGGIPPAGLDMNGILFAITQITRWSNAGGLYTFNSSFANDVNVGGYPSGAELMSADLQGSWISLNDNNTDNPDTGVGTKWVPGRAYGITSISGLTNANVTLTPAQAAKNKITLAGTLTGNIQIVMPSWLREWTFINNTTGNFTITVKTSAGTGVVLASGQQKVTGDGTNIVQPIENDVTPPALDNSTKRATTQWVKGNGLTYSGVNSYAVSTTLNNGNVGSVTAFTGSTTGQVLTMPLASSVRIADVAAIVNVGTAPVSVVPQGSDAITAHGAAINPLILQPGDSVTMFAGTGSWIICGGTAAFQYVQNAYPGGVVGASRGLKASMAAAGTSLTISGVETVAKSALGGSAFVNASWSDTINIATTGAGGMDTGSAPLSGYVAIYRIYNPTTNTWKLLGYNATSAIAPEVYGGANMPAGYTASALVSVWPTNGSGQFIVGFQRDRRISRSAVNALNSNVPQASFTSLSISSIVPPNATSVGGGTNITSSSAGSNATLNVSGDVGASGLQSGGSYIGGAGIGQGGTFACDLSAQQTIYYQSSVSAGTPTYQIYVSSYSF